MQIRLQAVVLAADSARVGRVERLLVESPSLAVRSLVIGRRLSTSSGRMVPFSQIVPSDLDDEAIHLSIPESAVQELPEYVDASTLHSASASSSQAPRVASFGDLSTPQIGGTEVIESSELMDMSERSDQVVFSRSTDLFSQEGRNLGRLAEIECDADGRIATFIGRGRIFQHGEVRISAEELVSCSSSQIRVALSVNEARTLTDEPAVQTGDPTETMEERVQDVMVDPVNTIPASEPARHALRRMEAETLRSLLVVEDHRYLGLVVERNLRILGGEELDRPIGELVQSDVPVLHPEMRLTNVETDAMLDWFPVVDDDGQLVGELSRSKLRRSAEDQTQAAETAPDPEAVENKFVVGKQVEGAGGQRLGTVDQVLTDGDTATALVIRHGLFGRRLTQIAIEYVTNVNSDKIVLSLARSDFKVLPNLEG